MIMEPGKSQHLQGEGAKPETKQSQRCSPALKARRLKSIFLFKSKGRKKPVSQFEDSQAGRILLLKGGSAFWFYSGL